MILGYWDIDSSRRALDAWKTVFRNRDIGISDPLYRGPFNAYVTYKDSQNSISFGLKKGGLSGRAYPHTFSMGVPPPGM